MRILRLAALASCVAASTVVSPSAQTIHRSPVVLDGTQASPGRTFQATVSFPAGPGSTYVLGFDALRAPAPIPLAGIGEVGIALSPAFFFLNVGTLDGSGASSVSLPLPANNALIGFQFYLQAFVQTAQSSAGAYLSNLYAGLIQGADTRRVAGASLSFSRALHTATKLADGSVLVVGGGGGSLTAPVGTQVAERYYPWTDHVDLTRAPGGPATQTTVPRVMHTATLLNDGRVLITGGVNTVGTVVASAEIYDPANGSFTAVGNMNVPRAGHTATRLPDGRVLIAGGTNAPFAFPGVFGGAQSTSEIYDPNAKTFTPGPSMLEKRMFHAACAIKQGGNDYVLFASGVKGLFLFLFPDYTATAEVYDVQSGTFRSQIGSTTVQPLNTARIVPGATVMQNGRVLIVGGVNGSVPAAIGATEEFDPSTGGWTARPTLAVPRALPATTALPDGRVLVEGGVQGSLTAPTATASALLFNGAAFNPTASYSTTRGAHAAVLLNSGAVLTLGGGDTAGTPLSSLEIYTP